VVQVPEERLRNLLEYRGSHNRFDMQLSKAHAEALAQIFQQYGQRRPASTPASGMMGLSMRADGGSAAGAGSSAGGERQVGGERQWKNGVIFICDSSTEQECISRRLLGLPKSQTSLLSKMGDSSYLFLFNVRTRQLLGVLQPDGPAGMDLEPSAWGGGRFPVQVRFKPASPTGQILSLPEAALGDVLRYRNATARFDLLLRAKALDKLVALFAQYGVPIHAGTGHAAASYGMAPSPHELGWGSLAASHLLHLPLLSPFAPTSHPPLTGADPAYQHPQQQQPPPPPPPPTQQQHSPHTQQPATASPSQPPSSRGAGKEGESSSEERARASDAYAEGAGASQLQTMLGALSLDQPPG